MEIKASVGRGGINRPEDVGIVQAFLNAGQRTHLSVDKRCGSKTVAAIISFQREFLRHPDGRVDPGGLTWQRLSARVTVDPMTVIVIGSPSPEQRYQLQFAAAAECLGKDSNTVWIVERTGYELYGINLKYFEKNAPRGGLIWLTPRSPLVDVLNKFGDQTIGRLVVFSHGVPGSVTLRYGWGTSNPDYGLSIPDVARLSRGKFTADAYIEFNSCNAGSETDSGNLAKKLATQIDRPVNAWTGRTSYAPINTGTCKIGPSTVTSVKEFFTEEVYSQWIKGRVPRLKTFQPPPAKR